LRLSIFDTEHAIEDTLKGTLDFCVVVTDAVREIPGMDVEVLGYDELVLVGAPGATPSSGRIGIDELAQLPFIEAPSGIMRWAFVDRQLRKLGVPQRTVVLQLGHPEAMKRAAREGLGVSLLFRSAVEDELSSGVLEEVRVDGAKLWVPILLVARKGKTFSPLHTALIQAIREELRNPENDAAGSEGAPIPMYS
jgi:DNA-binding transcriptional LysR family regulator